MNKILSLAGAAMAAYLDLTVGALIIALLYAASGTPATLAQLALGSVLAVLPDFDIVWPIVSGRMIDYNHRHTILHRPAFLLPLVAVAGELVGGPLWGIGATACVFWHFIHDSWPLSDGGVAWFFPLSERYWSLRGSEEPQPAPDAHWRVWVQERWLTPSTASVAEMTAGSLCLGLCAFIVSRGIALAAAAALASLLATGLVWVTYRALGHT